MKKKQSDKQENGVRSMRFCWFCLQIRVKLVLKENTVKSVETKSLCCLAQGRGGFRNCFMFLVCVWSKTLAEIVPTFLFRFYSIKCSK